MDDRNRHLTITTLHQFSMYNFTNNDLQEQRLIKSRIKCTKKGRFNALLVDRYKDADVIITVLFLVSLVLLESLEGWMCFYWWIWLTWLQHILCRLLTICALESGLYGFSDQVDHCKIPLINMLCIIKVTDHNYLTHPLSIKFTVYDYRYDLLQDGT